MTRLLPRPPLHDKTISHQWREWLRRAYTRVGVAGEILFSNLGFTGSNITSIETRNHNDLQSFNGGSATERYHLTQSQHDTLTDGSNADSLHSHAAVFTADSILLTPDDDLVTDGNGNVMTS